MAWINSDGLRVPFGREFGTVGAGGQYATASDGNKHVVELTIDLADLGTAAAIVDEYVVLPIGAFIQKVEVETLVAVTGTNAALNLGTVRTTDRTTEVDADGLGKAAALTQTAMATKGTILTYVTGTANAGAQIGTELATYPQLITADYDTAAFTAGRVAVRVYWSKQTT
jgi:hypothetical protein